MRFVPKYLEALGASVFLIGLYDALKTLLGAVYAYPGGVLTDRWGQRRALLVFTVASLAGYAVVLLVPHRAGVVLGMFLFLAWSNLSLPASFSLVASTLPSDKHAMGIGIQSLIKRVPIIAGPIAGGLLIDHLGIISGVRTGAAASLVFGCVAVVAQGALRKEPPVPTPQRSGLLGAVRGFRPELRRLLVSDILIRFCERIPAAWIVIHAMNHLGVSASQFGLLTAVEMIAAILCYIPASHYADRYGKEPFVIATFVCFTLFPAALALSDSLPLLLVAFVVRGLKEFGEPARKALIIAHAPADRRGQAIGAYYLIRDVVASSGAIVGAALWSFGPRVTFWSAFAVGATGTLAYTTAVRKGDRLRW